MKEKKKDFLKRKKLKSQIKQIENNEKIGFLDVTPRKKVYRDPLDGFDFLYYQRFLNRYL